MSSKSIVSQFRRSNDGLLERIISGEDEATVVKRKMRKERNKRDIRRELNSLSILNGLFKGAIVRKNWVQYSSVLLSCNTAE